MISRTRVLSLIIIGVVATVGVVAFLVFFPPSSCSIGAAPPSVHFTLIESSLGYNDSKDHPPSWPVMTVHCGQMVTIHLQNIDTAEAHGFMMDKYHVSEIVLQPGTSADISFSATQTGNFTFRCTIPCVVHQYMLSGKLVVTN